MADNKKADGIADDKKQERVLYGIQPRRQKIYKFYKLLRLYFWFIIAFSIIMIGVTFIQDSTVQAITGNKYYRYIAIGILGITLVILLVLLFIKHILLRKCPFDDWVYDIAQKRVGTDVIFYDNKYLWIQYDRGNKEVDKKDFVIEMSDKSDKYSYFYIKTWIDEGVLQVETKKKTVIPNKASKNMEDDKYPNIIPIGLARDDVHQKISPIGWWINDNEKNKEMIMTSPSVSILIVGGPLGLDTIIPTTNGYKTMRTIEVGDYVFDVNNKPVRVLGKSKIFNNKTIYKLSLLNGSDKKEIYCSQDHRFPVMSFDNTYTDVQCKDINTNDIILGNFYNYTLIDKTVIDTIPTQCILIDSPEHEFLITDKSENGWKGGNEYTYPALYSRNTGCHAKGEKIIVANNLITDVDTLE